MLYCALNGILNAKFPYFYYIEIFNDKTFSMRE